MQAIELNQFQRDKIQAILKKEGLEGLRANVLSNIQKPISEEKAKLLLSIYEYGIKLGDHHEVVTEEVVEKACEKVVSELNNIETNDVRIDEPKHEGFAFSKCPKCIAENIVLCYNCYHIDKFNITDEACTCGCGNLIPGITCPECSASIFFVNFFATTENSKLNEEALAMANDKDHRVKMQEANSEAHSFKDSVDKISLVVSWIMLILLFLFSTFVAIGVYDKIHFTGFLVATISVPCFGYYLCRILAKFYTYPIYVAIRRNHPDTSAIMIFTIFSGWSVLAWFISLGWAFMGGKEPKYV